MSRPCIVLDSVASLVGELVKKEIRLYNSIGQFLPSSTYPNRGFLIFIVWMCLYRKAAIAQHPLAMYRLGLADLNGDLGQPRKPKDGVKWLKRAAEVRILENINSTDLQNRLSLVLILTR
jgi:hypothetical protein